MALTAWIQGRSIESSYRHNSEKHGLFLVFQLYRPTIERNVLKDQIPEVYWFMAYLLEALWSRLPIQKLLHLISKASITRSQTLDCKPLCISAVILQLLPSLSLIKTWLDIAVSLSIYVGYLRCFRARFPAMPEEGGGESSTDVGLAGP